MIGIYERSLCQSYASAYRAGIKIGEAETRGSIAPDEEMAIRMWDERAGELKPDSWEKLEEDVNLGCRDYCEKHHLEECDYNMRVHMLDRAKKLAGIEEAQR